MSSKLLRPKYIAYIDEAGDDGLQNLLPIDRKGSSEWLMMSAVVIDASREPQTYTWLSKMIKSVDRHQLRSLHFKNCNTMEGRLICRQLASLPIRLFIVASNKKNMRRYYNPYPAMISSKNWFYCWLTRLLLERVTYFAERKSIQEVGVPHPLKVVLSERGRFDYEQLMHYYDWLQWRCETGKNKLPLGELSWSVMRRDLFSVLANETQPGLQFADVVASSFFRSCDLYQVSERDPECAKLLEPRIARDPDRQTGRLLGFGVKLMPKWKEAQLTTEQQEIFRFYGYPNYQWWMPRKE